MNQPTCLLLLTLLLLAGTASAMTDSGLKLDILSIQSLGGDVCRIKVRVTGTVPGVRYQLQSSVNLFAWTNTAGFVGGAGGTNELSFIQSGSPAFFRVQSPLRERFIMEALVCFSAGLLLGHCLWQAFRY